MNSEILSKLNHYRRLQRDLEDIAKELNIDISGDKIYNILIIYQQILKEVDKS